MVSSTVSWPAKQEEEGVSSNGAVADSRVASAVGEGTAETGIEVDSAIGEVTASTGSLLLYHFCWADATLARQACRLQCRIRMSPL